jgi:hypothetical protein
MHRRTFLAGALAALAGLPSLTLARGARAQQPRGRLKTMSRDALGTTLVLGVPHAPFAGTGYGDDTVIVFVPDHYRYRAEEGVPVLVHFHGHNSSAERALAAHELREQLVDSRQNAVLVVPQLAVFAADSSCGRLDSPGGLARMLGDALPAAASEGKVTLGDSAFPERARLGRVCVSAHSGGYHAAACSLKEGGVDVHETYLFDSLYSESDVFRDWVFARKSAPASSRHKLVSYFTVGAPTEPVNAALRAELEKARVLVAEEMQEGELSRHDLSHACAVFVRTAVGHSQVTWETNALRDVLFASTLPRHLPATWFANRTGSRPIERRR